MCVLMVGALLAGLLLPLVLRLTSVLNSRRHGINQSLVYPLLPPAAWLLGAGWLWQTKPEVWFIYYLHTAVWAFVGVAATLMWKNRGALQTTAAALLGGLSTFILVLFTYVNVSQAQRLSESATWNWNSYREFVECIDQSLTATENSLGKIAAFRVWGPTFPDVLIELSRKHEHWQFTRTNDFWERSDLAIQHGRDVEAVVVTEILSPVERDISAPAQDYPEIKSAWMTWSQHFLNQLWKDPKWKPNRYICQRGRWQAFIFTN